VILLSPASSVRLFTAAEAQAQANWSANRAALSQTQPRLGESLDDIPPDLTWVFARDGSLTAMTASGTWWADCSVPLLAGHALLKSLDSSHLMSCYLAPTHAGLLRAARQRNGEYAALLAVIPDPAALRVILACHDFSAEIAGHHLWFVTGEHWPEQVRQLFNDHPGLPTPARFIRTKLTPDEMVEPMIAEAQRVFSSVLSERTKQIESLRHQSPGAVDHRRVLLIAGTRFRLWENAADALAEQMMSLATDANIERFDGDDPASSSPLALATAAGCCGMIVAADFSRADAVNLAPMETPWITWITRPQTPSFTTAGPRDALIVADPAWQALAMTAGWPADRVTVGGWPSPKLPEVFDSHRSLAILADTRPIEIPPSVEDLSSHRVLWDGIESELRADPLALGEDVAGFLDSRARQLDIAPDTLDHRRFFDDLILPGYQQGLARVLMEAGLPLRLYGRGWDQLAEFRPVSLGELSTRAAFTTAVAAAAALVHVWPLHHAHPIDALGKPIVHRTGRRKESFLREAKLALTALPSQQPQSNRSLASVQESLKFWIDRGLSGR
jgi:hypothetical protein